MKPIVSAALGIEVQFYDLDPMNVVWHGNYPRFFEAARRALMRDIGYGYETMQLSGFMWPVIDMHVRYYRPLTLATSAEITAGIVEWENRLKINYLIRDIESGRKLTTGHTVQVAVDMATEEMKWRSPPVLFEKLAPYLP